MTRVARVEGQMQMRTITVIGSINIDLVVAGERLPREGETVLGSDFRVVCGGKGANQAVAAARLGGRVQMVGCIGDDEYGRIAKANLERHGVGVGAVKRAKGPTGVALIVVDAEGRNQIAVAPNANDHVRVPRRAFDIAVMQMETPYALPRAKCFILNPAPANQQITQARGKGRRTGRFAPLAGVDYLLPNEHEAEILSGERDPRRAVRRLMKLGARRVVITLGEEGVFDGASERRVPAFRVKVVDTVGAGDAFVGALAAALAEGHPEPIRFAQAAAALKCTRAGAQNGPSRREVDALLR